MNHYKSWSGLQKQLTDCLCESLQGRITYFLTRYHSVHNAYGRASIRYDGKEFVRFSCVEMLQQDDDLNEWWQKTGNWDHNAPELNDQWNQNATYSDTDFLNAANEFLRLPIQDALNSDNYLIRIFAILDKRVGRRTLERLKINREPEEHPQWVRQFYELRIRESISSAKSKKAESGQSAGSGMNDAS